MADNYLHQEHRTETRRLDTFLMAASVSAIGFAMYQTTDRLWHWSLWFTFLAVAIWCYSIFAGVKRSHSIGVILKNNHLANVSRTVLDDQPANEEAKVINEVSKEVIDEMIVSGRKWHDNQLFSLLCGAIIYFIGHICKILYENPALAETSKTI